MDRRRRISLAYRDAVLATNPVAYWRLGEASGTVARDEIGANNGTYVGSPTLGVAGLLSGDANTAVTFAAVGSLVSVADSSPFRFVGSAPFSIAMWSDHGADASYKYVLGCVNGTGVGWAVRGTPSGFGCARGAESVITASYASGSHLVVMTYDGTTLRAFLDGAQSGSPVASGSALPSDSTFYLGYSIFNGSSGSTLDEPVVWNRALTPAEDAGLYAAGMGR